MILPFFNLFEFLEFINATKEYLACKKNFWIRETDQNS